MIAKGNTHNNGSTLATYLTTDKGDERAELWQLRGFEAINIKDAFRDIDIMAGATRCQQPFFHGQVRSPAGEKWTRPMWESAADHIENALGLTGQPRAIVLHIDRNTGDEHMHVAWSRINQDTMKAIPLPYFKYQMMAISREMELEFGLKPVRSEREGPIRYGPTRAEFEQARRLGVDIHTVRNTIRDCWDRSDSARSFDDNLAEKGYVLARGDSGVFVALDPAGGIYGLNQRLLDVKIADIRLKLSPLQNIPTIEQARESMLDIPSKQDRLVAWHLELAEIDRLISLHSLKKEGERVDRLIAGMKQWEAEKPEAPNRERTAGQIRLSYVSSLTGQEFADALEDRGLILAQVNETDAERLNRWERKRIKELPPQRDEDQYRTKADYQRYRMGELVVVDQRGDVYQLTRANTGDEFRARQEHLKGIDRDQLLDVSAADNVMKKVREQQHAERNLKHAQKREERQTAFNESRWPINPPQPERKAPGLFREAGHDAGRDTRADSERGLAAAVWKMWTSIDHEKLFEEFGNGPFSVPTYQRRTVVNQPTPGFPVEVSADQFATLLDDKGIMFAKATKEEAERSHREASFAREVGNYTPRFKEGEIVIVTEPNPELRRDGLIVVPGRIHKVDQSLARKYVEPIGQTGKLQSIEATLTVSEQRSAKRKEERATERTELSRDIKDFSRTMGKPAKSFTPTISRAAGKLADSFAKPVHVMADAMDSFLSPPMTPERMAEAQEAVNLREDLAEKAHRDRGRER